MTTRPWLCLHPVHSIKPRPCSQRRAIADTVNGLRRPLRCPEGVPPSALSAYNTQQIRSRPWHLLDSKRRPAW